MVHGVSRVGRLRSTSTPSACDRCVRTVCCSTDIPELGLMGPTRSRRISPDSRAYFSPNSEVPMPPRISASMLYSLVVCPHGVERALFADPAEMDPPSAFVELLWERGNAYEVSVIAHLVPPPMNIRDLPKDARLEATTRAMDDRTPLIFGGRLEAADLIGEPDLLRLDGDGYVAGDIKSGRGDEGGDEDSPAQLKLHYAVQLAPSTRLLATPEGGGGGGGGGRAPPRPAQVPLGVTAPPLRGFPGGVGGVCPAKSRVKGASC